ncbi:aminomethyltransferase folate-binding domain-containing protein [Vitreoscilla sp. C1]|uniref:sarcosine oxidase subunit alpha family protein n=1 Tax=Vitreoscilla sp. (strain C1) TaxID=96942 RepID=UPI00148EBF98|nr:sarcosine oxidase subunit alpha family protein [Vitreoscilla sp. C1]QJQ52233.1 aminomethyltransferase folate-binding domain-containing protein [Vitreoscilla sp. C1]
MSAKRVFKASVQIDENQPLTFEFDGKTYQGYQGDTLASALLANGVKAVARSYKYGRLRGIMSAGAEEPNALVQMESGAYSAPNIKATQAELYAGLSAFRTSGWPSLEFDIKGVMGKVGQNMMGPGFYSKTFKWPPKMWPMYENVIRQFAGFGETPPVGDAEYYDHLHHHVDVLVVGGGVSGLQAAFHCAQSGLKVLLVDEQAQMGGWLLSDTNTTFNGLKGVDYANSLCEKLAQYANVEILSRTTAFALHDHNMIQAVELLQDHLPIDQRDSSQPRHRLHRIRAKQVILASGAIERPLVFGNNDMPGVFTVSAAQTYLNRYGVLLGERVVVCGNNDEIYLAARDLAQAGAIVTVADTRPNANIPDYLPRSVKVHLHHGVGKVGGKNHVERATLIDLKSLQTFNVDAEVVLSSGGLSPTVHLYCHDTSRPIWSEAHLSFVVPAVYQDCKAHVCNIGAITGQKTFQAALKQTEQVLAAFFAAQNIQHDVVLPVVNEAAHQDMVLAVRIPDGMAAGTGPKAFVDYQNDVTAEAIKQTIQENYRHIEHVKRYTAFGFGTDQGKLSSVNSFILTAEAMNVPVEQVSTTTYRPAYTPVSLGALAGVDVGNTFDPERITAIHQSHVARDAAFEPVGQWLRPWYFAKNGEDIHAAVKRECLAARNGVAVMDASTLGKIQIDGPDAREFLNRIYSNAWTKLEPGKCRYGLMLNENGMVMDDGVTACINDEQFYMTTTTGGAANVLSWLELWHQTEWSDLDVWLTSVTDHWSTIAVVGPKARQVLQKLCPDIDFAAENFKFMDWRAGTVAGLPARVFRVSFSGELAYEINVEAGFGQYLWEQVMAAGKEFDITPYGTETLHVLRAEKGFIIVGQDTDGSVTPIDLGMAWAVGMKKPFSFLGKRSLSRSDTARDNRKHLVGVLALDASVVIPEGAQIIASNNITVPRVGSSDAKIPLLGHITSSYDSAFLGRSIAMAVIENGRNMVGKTLYAYAQGKIIPFTVADSCVFVDAEGVRQHA